MGLSPSTLFHFTSKNGLNGILKENFKLKYCSEEISHQSKPVEIAIPMVSFCDIKISEISEHIEKYGSYGIGLSKEWATKMGLNPVLYMNSNSAFANKLISAIRIVQINEKVANEDRWQLSNVVRYMKIYEGNLIRKGKTIPNYRFADEREWRYVPEIKTKSKFSHWLLKEQYDTPEKKYNENQKLAGERLLFEPKDILYIIVKKESEIDEIIKHIRSVKGINYTANEVDRLTSRILTCERIFNDF